ADYQAELAPGGVDLLKRAGDAGAEDFKCADRYDCDKGEDQAVFGQALALFVAGLEFDVLLGGPVVELRHGVSYLFLCWFVSRLPLRRVPHPWLLRPGSSWRMAPGAFFLGFGAPVSGA